MLDSALDVLQRQRDGEISAEEVTAQALAAIDASQAVHNAYTHVDHEGAIQTARRIDQKRAAGESLVPLAGVPISVKDVLCTADMPTTCSSNMLRGFRPPYNATVVEKMRAADAVIVGKTNMDEFAMGASTETSAFGVTGNPWDPTRTPGGPGCSGRRLASRRCAGFGRRELRRR